MHPTNKIRRMAGLSLDLELERQFIKSQTVTEDVSVSNMTPVTSKKNMIFFLVRNPGKNSIANDIFVKCNGESFALMFIGAGGSRIAGELSRKKLFKEAWTLYFEHEASRAAADASQRLSKAGIEEEITEDFIEKMVEVDFELFEDIEYEGEGLFEYGFDETGRSSLMHPERRAKFVRPRLKKKAIETYQKMREQGREPFEAVQAVAGMLDLNRMVLKYVLNAAGIKEGTEGDYVKDEKNRLWEVISTDEESTCQLRCPKFGDEISADVSTLVEVDSSIVDKVFEDHFKYGEKVKGPDGREWETLGSKGGEGDEELYEVKCTKKGTKSELPAKVLVRESEYQFLVSLNEVDGIWKRVDKSLLKEVMNLRNSNPTMAHRIFKAARIPLTRNPLTPKDIEEANSILADAIKTVYRESVHYYTDNYASFEDDEEKPVNVSDGNANDEQIYDGKKRKEESPSQLAEPGDLGPVDKTEYDQDAKMTVPPEIMKSLKDAVEKARMESNKVVDDASAQFYRDLAIAMEDLQIHLDKGTVYGVKQAQIFATTLMGPMLHKLPDNVWKWLTNAGKTRSLKDYMKEVKVKKD